jgi:hypothetical protein
VSRPVSRSDTPLRVTFWSCWSWARLSTSVLEGHISPLRAGTHRDLQHAEIAYVFCIRRCAMSYILHDRNNEQMLVPITLVPITLVPITLVPITLVPITLVPITLVPITLLRGGSVEASISRARTCRRRARDSRSSSWRCAARPIPWPWTGSAGTHSCSPRWPSSDTPPGLKPNGFSVHPRRYPRESPKALPAP